MSWINATLLLAVAVLGLAIWSIKRHKDPQLQLESAEPLEKLIPSISGMSLGMAIRGNAVEIYENGAFFDALLEDIAAARHHVHFETFLWKEGRIGGRLAEAFSAKARTGVKVRLVLDALGCKKMGKSAQAQMREAGCELAIYHPRTLKNIGVLPEKCATCPCACEGRSCTRCTPLSARTGSRSPASFLSGPNTFRPSSRRARSRRTWRA